MFVSLRRSRLGRLSQHLRLHQFNCETVDLLTAKKQLSSPPFCQFSLSLSCSGVRTTVRVDDLPQGILPKSLCSLPPDPERNTSYPTVIQQARNNMRKFENCVVLTRVGGFYELYFEQAEKFGPLLNLKIGRKSTSVGPVPMAGFPYFQLDRFLRTLVQELSQAVAISEEFPNSSTEKAKNGGLLFDRKVTRIVTSGTLVDEKFIDPHENNFLLAVTAFPLWQSSSPADITAKAHTFHEAHPSSTEGTPTQSHVGLAWLDLSTGEFFTQIAPLGELASATARIGAKETIIDSSVPTPEYEEILRAIAPCPVVPWMQTAYESSLTQWSELVNPTALLPTEERFTEHELSAALTLLNYVNDRLQGTNAKLQAPVRYRNAENMGIDANTLKGLEILATSKEAITCGKGSLLHSIRRTVSSGGARLLRSRLSSPSTSLATINQRLDLVQALIDNKEHREQLLFSLRRTFDTQRLVQKFSLGRGDVDDLVCLHKTIAATRTVQATLENIITQLSKHDGAVPIKSIMSVQSRISMDGPEKLASRIAAAIDEDVLTELHRSEEAQAIATLAMARDVVSQEGDREDMDVLPRTAKGKTASSPLRSSDSPQLESWKMRRTASSMLAALHSELDVLIDAKNSLEQRLQSELQANSLTLRWTPGQGHICHVRGLKDVRASMLHSPSARNASTSKSTRSFYWPEWTKLGTKIDQHKLRILAEEESVFADLRSAVIKNLVRLRRNAAVLDELDVACSSAVLAEEEGLVRPLLNDGKRLNIVGGRHATVKLGLDEQGRAFVDNNCNVGDEELAWLITGPNMAGKSTFLRQNALIAILAQVGLFVPAAYAEVGIVDHVFSRIGAADNLYQDQSTFMVEMLESAHILQTATPRSLVIMDEVGRGTTPDDGTAVAYACLHHLYHVNRCRTLFATHFHALVDMTQDWERLGRYCTDVAESASGHFHYDYRLRAGVNRRSHALKVAQLAGLPTAAINVAQRVLSDGQPLAAPPTQRSAAGTL